MPRRKSRWDESKIAVILERMRSAYDKRDDPKHVLSLLDALEIIVMEVVGMDADKAFDLMTQLRKILEKEAETWRPPLKGKK